MMAPKLELLLIHQTEELMGMDSSRVPSSTDLSGWERLTDPRSHSDSNFKYQIHAVASNTYVRHALQQIFILEQMKRDPTLKYERIDLLTTPDKIAEKTIISTSLIDAEHRETWVGAGYILRVPTANILKTSSSDIGTQFHEGVKTRARLYSERDTQGIADPNRILQYTSPCAYNEVVVTGTGRNGEKVEIAGVFVKVFPNGELVDEDLTRRIQPLAWCRNLPIVRIQEPFFPYQNGQVRVFPDGFNYTLNGKLYLFLSEQSSFTVSQYGGKKSWAMTPQERTGMVQAVRQYLTSTPHEELGTLLALAEKVPDHILQQRVEQQERYKRNLSLGDNGHKIYDHPTIPTFYRLE